MFLKRMRDVPIGWMQVVKMISVLPEKGYGKTPSSNESTIRFFWNEEPTSHIQQLNTQSNINSTIRSI